ncbi:MAG: hydroxypyruvate isomerase family protein [Roseovarius sp.]
MTRFSANLGFLWTDRGLPDAIRAAHHAGFDAVECHWPYDTPSQQVRAALQDTGLPMLGLNTRRGNVAGGENGLCALPGRQDEARAAIDEALGYARAIGACAVHVMAGVTDEPAAHDTFLENLHYACHTAQPDVTVLIEPLNPYDAPGYFLRDTVQAAGIIQQVRAPNLKLMFDCYHVARTEGDVSARLSALWGVIGHIQFAGVPDRGRPDRGTLDYALLFKQIEDKGWARPLGAEYKAGTDTDRSLGWMSTLRGEAKPG